MLPAAANIQQHAATSTEFPPRQAPPDFNAQAIVDATLKAVHSAATDTCPLGR